MTKLAVLTIVFAACQNEFGGPDGDRGYSISVNELAFEHELGVTACPQNLGDVVVTNETESVLVFSVSVTDTEGTDVIDFGAADDSAPTATGSIELEAAVGGSVAFVPWFNCQNQILVDSTIRIDPEDLGLPFTTFGVSGTIIR